MSDVTRLDVLQRAVVLQLLRGDHDERWTFEELHAEIRDAPPDTLRQAITKLETAKAIETIGGPRLVIWASDGIRYLDTLGLVGV